MKETTNNTSPFEVFKAELLNQQSINPDYTFEDCTWAFWSVVGKKILYAESTFKLANRDQDCFDINFENPPVIISSDNYTAVSGDGKEILIFKNINLING